MRGRWLSDGCPGGSRRSGAGGAECARDAAAIAQAEVALFCSRRCTGAAIVALYDAARALRTADLRVVSGFHTPMERECLTVLLRGRDAVVVLARRESGSCSRHGGRRWPPVNWWQCRRSMRGWAVESGAGAGA